MPCFVCHYRLFRKQTIHICPSYLPMLGRDIHLCELPSCRCLPSGDGIALQEFNNRHISKLSFYIYIMLCIISQFWESMDGRNTSSWTRRTYPGSKIHAATMGTIWGRQDPGGPHVGPMNFAIWVRTVHSDHRLYRWVGCNGPGNQQPWWWCNLPGIIRKQHQNSLQ